MKRQIRSTLLALSCAAMAAAGTFHAQLACAASAATKADAEVAAEDSNVDAATTEKDAAAKDADAKEVAAKELEAKDADSKDIASTDIAPKNVELFEGMHNGDLDVTIIAKSDHAGRVIIANKTGKPVNIKLPEAFAAVPVVAQFGGGGGGGQGGGGFGGGGGGGGGQQSRRRRIRRWRRRAGRRWRHVQHPAR